MHGEVHKVRHDSRLANPTNRSDAQNVATFDSEMRFANLIGSMNDAVSPLRSASVTPRATLQAPQTKTGTYSPTADSDRSDRVQVCGTNRVGVRRRRRKV